MGDFEHMQWNCMMERFGQENGGGHGGGDANEQKLAKYVGDPQDVKLLASTMEWAMKIHMDVGQERAWLLLYLQWGTLFRSA